MGRGGKEGPEVEGGVSVDRECGGGVLGGVCV